MTRALANIQIVINRLLRSLCITKGPPLVERRAPPTKGNIYSIARMGTSEPVRAPPEVSRTRGHRLAKPRSDRIVVEFRALKSAISGSTIGLGGKIMDFLSLPNCAPEVFVHARRDVFVVRMCDVFAYRLRVLEAVTANAAMPLVAGENVRTPLGAFRVIFGIGHFQIL